MQVLKRKVDQSFLEEIGMPVTRAAKKTTCEASMDKDAQKSSQIETFFSSNCGSPKGICSPARPSFDLSVDGTSASLRVSANLQHTGNSMQDNEGKCAAGSSFPSQPSAVQHGQQMALPTPVLRPVITRRTVSGGHGLDSPRSCQKQSPRGPHLPPPQTIESPRRRTRSQEALQSQEILSQPCSMQTSPAAAQTEEAVLERQASGLSIEEDGNKMANGASSSQAAAEGAAQESQAADQQPPGEAAASAKQKTTPRSCLRRKHQQKADGTPDLLQPIGRGGGRTAAVTAAEDPCPRSPRRSPRRRVRFARGPLEENYETPDGHPDHEGQTARQRRALNVSYPLDLTPSSIKMLEIELGESYRPSLDRLKRRVGLLPRIPRPRRHVTALKADKANAAAAAKPAALRALRVLRMRPPLAQDSDDSDEQGIESPTSSSSTISDDWANMLFGSSLRHSTRSTASTLGSPRSAVVESPRAEWSASSGGVRHGAARSVAAGRRKPAPSGSRDPGPRGARSSSPKSPRSPQKHCQAQSGPTLQHTQPSPQKRRAPCSEAPSGDASDGHPRSPRRQRPMTSAPAAQPAMTGSISLFALPRPTLAGTSLPLSHEGQMFSRRGTLRSASVSSAPASSAPHACADTPMPSAQPGNEEQQSCSPVRALPPLAACLQPGPQPSVRLFCSPPSKISGNAGPPSSREHLGDPEGAWLRPRRSIGGTRAPPGAPSGATVTELEDPGGPSIGHQRGNLNYREDPLRNGAGRRERRAIGSLYDPLLPQYFPHLKPRRSADGCWPPKSAGVLPSYQ